jgi:hypothetical protein
MNGTYMEGDKARIGPAPRNRRAYPLGRRQSRKNGQDLRLRRALKHGDTDKPRTDDLPEICQQYLEQPRSGRGGVERFDHAGYRIFRLGGRRR